MHFMRYGGGANDYLFGDVTNPNQAVNQTVSNLTNAITSLADAGAKNIAVFNLPDLGQIPVSIAQGDQISTGLTQITQGHNTALDQALDVLSANSDVNIIRVDINSLFNEVASNPGEFGFTQDPNVPCLIGVIGNFTSVCDNPNEFISFDGFHPTSRSHRLVANEVLSAINHKTVPESSTVLSTIAVGAIGTAGVLKRKRKKILR